jgi:UDP-N-acetyl-D-mannosaminuronate dehydrogenase
MDCTVCNNCWYALSTFNKVAEAAKVIENSQRDINIAFVNELAKIFNEY